MTLLIFFGLTTFARVGLGKKRGCLPAFARISGEYPDVGKAFTRSFQGGLTEMKGLAGDAQLSILQGLNLDWQTRILSQLLWDSAREITFLERDNNKQAAADLRKTREQLLAYAKKLVEENSTEGQYRADLAHPTAEAALRYLNLSRLGLYVSSDSKLNDYKRGVEVTKLLSPAERGNVLSVSEDSSMVKADLDRDRFPSPQYAPVSGVATAQQGRDRDGYYYGPTARDRFVSDVAEGMSRYDATVKTNYSPYPSEQFMARVVQGESPEKVADNLHYGLSERDRFFLNVWNGNSVSEASEKSHYYPFPREKQMLEVYEGKSPDDAAQDTHYSPFPGDRYHERATGPGRRKEVFLSAYYEPE